MHIGGFTDVLGLDPFIEQSLDYDCGVRVIRQELGDFARSTEKRFGLVMFHHSLEHLAEPVAALRAAVGGEAASFVHWGVTTHEVIDTGWVLRLRALNALIDAALESIAGALAVLARDHAATPMAG